LAQQSEYAVSGGCAAGTTGGCCVALLDINELFLIVALAQHQKRERKTGATDAPMKRHPMEIGLTDGANSGRSL
jgi:hypothetical protein